MARNVTLSRLGWSLGELSAATGLSVGLLRKEVRCGALQVRRIGRRVIVLEEDWRRYISGRKNEGDAAVPTS